MKFWEYIWYTHEHKESRKGNMMQAISFYSLKLKRKIMVNAQDITLVHLPNGRPAARATAEYEGNTYRLYKLLKDKEAEILTQEVKMNVIGTIMNLWNLNRGLPASGKVVIKEGIDVISALGRSLKDNKITAKEKAVIVNEIRQFSNAAIKTLESITIPEEKPKGKKK